jgi:hypothetical protein
MAGSVWIVAAVVVLLVTAAVYLAVRLGLRAFDALVRAARAMARIL